MHLRWSQTSMSESSSHPPIINPEFSLDSSLAFWSQTQGHRWKQRVAWKSAVTCVKMTNELIVSLVDTKLHSLVCCSFFKIPPLFHTQLDFQTLAQVVTPKWMPNTNSTRWVENTNDEPTGTFPVGTSLWHFPFEPSWQLPFRDCQWGTPTPSTWRIQGIFILAHFSVAGVCWGVLEFRLNMVCCPHLFTPTPANILSCLSINYC